MKTLLYCFNIPSKRIGAEFHLQAVKQNFKEKKKKIKIIPLTTEIHAYCIMQLGTLIKLYSARIKDREAHPNPLHWEKVKQYRVIL